MSIAARDLFEGGTRALLEGNAPLGRSVLSRAVSLAPLEVSARFNYAVALRLQGELSEALEQSRGLLRIGVRAPQAFALTGILCQLRGNLEEAMSLFRCALSEDPTHRVSRYYLGMALARTGQRNEAMVCLREAIALGGAQALPELVVERIRAQLYDLGALGDLDVPWQSTLCGTNVISEVMLPEGSLFDLMPPGLCALGPDGASNPGVFRAVDPEGAATMVHRAKRTVALTGAGMSVESGLHTRKSLWEVFDRDEAVSAARYHQNPSTLWRVIRDFLGDNTHQPNPAHVWLPRIPRLAGIITQNVDGLHQRADPTWESRYPIVELHGSLDATRCTRCGASGSSCGYYVLGDGPLPPRCLACQGSLRPEVVLFGESLRADRLSEAAELARSCDLMIVLGCAMDVSPASELPRIAARKGALILELKTEASRISEALGTAVLLGPGATTLRAMLVALSALEGVDLREVDAAIRVPREITPTWTEAIPPVEVSQSEFTLSEYLRRPGEIVRAEEPLAYIETDKTATELVALRGGRVKRLLLSPGTTAAPGTAYIELEALEGDQRPLPKPLDAKSPKPEIDPFIQDFGRFSGEVRALLAGVMERPWLSPDASLALHEGSALDWLAERLDEHAAALMRFDDSFEALPLSLFVTRDAAEAQGRFNSGFASLRGRDLHGSWFTEALKPMDRRWSEALTRAAAGLADSPRSRIARVAHEVQRLGLRTLLEEDTMMLSTAQGQHLSPLYLWLMWCATYGPEGGPCPWKPIVEIWLRGAWPFALSDGVLGVYIPVLANLRVIPSPGSDTPGDYTLGLWSIPHPSTFFNGMLMVPMAHRRVKVAR